MRCVPYGWATCNVEAATWSAPYSATTGCRDLGTADERIVLAGAGRCVSSGGMAAYPLAMDSAVPPPAPAATTVDEVIARMRSIDAVLPATDGVASFNRMYLEVTLGVSQRVEQGFFGDPAFVSRLDVVFANLYFGAVDALSAPLSALPVAWQPLLAARSTPGIE